MNFGLNFLKLLATSCPTTHTARWQQAAKDACRERQISSPVLARFDSTRRGLGCLESWLDPDVDVGSTGTLPMASNWWSAINNVVQDVSAAAGEVWTEIASVVAPVEEGAGGVGGVGDAEVREIDSSRAPCSLSVCCVI